MVPADLHVLELSGICPDPHIPRHPLTFYPFVLVIDTCKVTIGARTLVASNVSFFAGSHPLDPEVRNGTKGPEWGMEIEVGEDCWIGGNASILPGVKIGKGSVVGAASVVTKVRVLIGSLNRDVLMSMS